jgi:tRNA modification GTPase
LSPPARDTIFALSSGLPPAGIAVVRISGPAAGLVLDALAGKRPAPRQASYRALRSCQGELLDHVLTLWFPGPATATGEDVAELHLHGGRAVVASVLAEIGNLDGLRPATPGEFTRRAFENGRIDLAEAEGLADLLAAETESQRQSALALAEGGLGRRVGAWQKALLSLSARIEAALDFSDEGDVGEVEGVHSDVAALVGEMAALLAEPGTERLRDGVRVVLAGSPNSGKSRLFNILVDREAAIVSDIAGTTRDRIEAAVALDGVPLVLIDTAGLRESEDAIEAIGVARAEDAVANADLVLWLGDAADAPDGSILVVAKSDLDDSRPGLPVSAVTGEGIAALKNELLARARDLLPRPGALALNRRHKAILLEVRESLDHAADAADPLIVAEHLRQARNHLDHLTGQSGVEDMLDALFGSMCIGK